MAALASGIKLLHKYDGCVIKLSFLAGDERVAWMRLLDAVCVKILSELGPLEKLYLLYNPTWRLQWSDWQ